MRTFRKATTQGESERQATGRRELASNDWTAKSPTARSAERRQAERSGAEASSEDPPSGVATSSLDLRAREVSLKFTDERRVSVTCAERPQGTNASGE